MSIFIANFNNVNINFPIHITKEELFETLDESVEKMEILQCSPYFSYLQLKKIEKLIDDNSVNGNVTQYVIEKVCGIIGVEVMKFILGYFTLIHHLIKHKYKNDELTFDNYGFVVATPKIDVDNTPEEFKKITKLLRKDWKKEMKVCGICSNPADKLCGICKSIYYCCREHQTEDWKRHKKECGKL
jgi:hypothetical protein